MTTRTVVLALLREAASQGLGVRRSGLRTRLPITSVSWGAIKTAISRLRKEGFDIVLRDSGPDPEYQLLLPGDKQ